MLEHTIEIRVRYQETDGQGRVHHANFLTYFEQGRVELLRSLGKSYRDLEEIGILLVVSEMTIRYYSAALFDDVLRITTRAIEARGARIKHEYRVYRGEELLAEGHSTVACVNREGRVSRLPEFLCQALSQNTNPTRQRGADR
jgi:acyl-CoA thioester hydrolase